jgi:ABC-2 type transport system permease protein
MLPAIWQTISKANPILYMINAFRYGLIGISDVNIELAYLITVGAILCLTFMSLLLLHKGIGIKN